jgi:hypothetical protein
VTLIPFFEDSALAAHLQSLQPRAPTRRHQSGDTKLFYGICSRWNRERGYGWVLSDGPIDGVPDKELFCHKSGLPKGIPFLNAADRVEFTLRPARATGKPPEAKIVRIIQTEALAAA